MNAMKKLINSIKGLYYLLQGFTMIVDIPADRSVIETPSEDAYIVRIEGVPSIAIPYYTKTARAAKSAFWKENKEIMKIINKKYTDLRVTKGEKYENY